MIEKMKELEGALRLAEQKFDDKNDDFERLKRDLVKVQLSLSLSPLILIVTSSIIFGNQSDCDTGLAVCSREQNLTDGKCLYLSLSNIFISCCIH